MQNVAKTNQYTNLNINTPYLCGTQQLNNRINNNIFCINCGKDGHISKKCNQPITSIGIICIKLNNININSIIKYIKKIQNNIEMSNFEKNDIKKIKSTINGDLSIFMDERIKYLLIRRRNTFSYIEFIRGKYNLENIDYLQYIIEYLTVDEKEIILQNTFDDLWKNFWGINHTNNTDEFNLSKLKFNKLKEGFCYKKNDITFFINLNVLFENTLHNFKEPEWGFPKGKRNNREKNIDCAKREFQEETNLTDNMFFILNNSPVDETFLASNNYRYKHIYYTAQFNNDIDSSLSIDLTNKHQLIEVSDIKWMSFNEAYKKIRDYNFERKLLLYNVHLNLKYMLDIILKSNT